MPELHVLLSTSRLPTVWQWQGAIDALGLPVVLDSGFSPADPIGSFPAVLGGRRVTVEFHTRPAGEVTAAWPGLKGMFPMRDLAATFRFGWDPVERACAWAALAGLCKAADGAWFDPQEGGCFDAEAAVGRAREAVGGVGVVG